MKYLAAILASGLVLCVPAADAAVSDEDFEQLKQQLALMSQRLDNLEAENRELRAAQDQVEVAVDEVETNLQAVQMSEPAGSVEDWSDRISLDGDFRYRFERIDPEGSQTRQRNRIRARTNITAEIADNTKVGFGLATGGDDPVSTNQTLGGGGSSKSVALNLAYVDWEVTDGLNLIAGKFKNPLYRAGKQALMWDGDWTPEGVAVKYTGDNYFINGFGSYLESDSGKSNDSFAWGGQFGMQGEVGGTRLLGGVSYYSIESAGKSTSYGDASDPGDFFGNTAIEPGGLPCGTNAGTDCVYRYDYLLTEVFAEASFDVGITPVTIFGNYVNNGDVSSNDTGWLMGTHIGQAKDRGQWQFSYYYADKGADAVIGLLTDSDFSGGGTDNKGHWLQLNWGMNKHWTIGAQYFINEVNVAGGSASDYNRLMIDTQWKWK